jgi:cytoskeletal protein CcmA (bactofilin family)
MAIFGGGRDKKAPTASGSARSAPAGPAGLSIIGAGMTVHGDVESAGVVKIEGTVNGHVHAGQQVLVAKGGQIDGDIETGEAVIGGIVHGAVRAQQRVEVQPGATVEGDVTTKRILVAEGAMLNGMVRMGEAEEAARPAPSRPVAQPTLPRPSAPLARVAVPPRASSPH